MNSKRQFITFMIFLCVKVLFAQEIFMSDQGILNKIQPDHLYLTTPEDYSDYISKDKTMSIGVSGASTTTGLSRFYENSTLGFQSNSGLLQIPNTVIRQAMTKEKGLTVTGWIRIDDLNANTSIGFFGKSNNADDVKVDFAVIGHRIVVRKRCFGKMCPIIKTDFTLNYGDYTPQKGDLTNGYIYFSVASDYQTCRITVSRPGGRLYTRWYYVSLMDAVLADDSFFWGRSPCTPNSSMNIPAFFDDIMVYDWSLKPEETLKAYYLQSPPFPGVSYYFESPDGYAPAPSDNRNQQPAFNEDYFRWFKDSYKRGTFSSNKWFLKTVSKPSQTADTRMYFSNARSGGNIYQKTGSYFLYQLLEPSANYAARTQYDVRRQIDPQNLYDPNPKVAYNVGTYWFKSVNAPTYCLGWANMDMYLTEMEDAYAWRVRGAKNVYTRGAESQLSITDTKTQFIMLKNEGLQKYIDIYWGGEYNYLILADKDVKREQQKFMIYAKETSDDGVYRKLTIKSALGLPISPYWGEQDQKEDEYIILHTQDFAWEIVYCRDDENDRPLYTIRANNGYGNYLLGYHTSMGTNPYYVCQASANVYDADGNVQKNFLWSVEVHGAGTN